MSDKLSQAQFSMQCSFIAKNAAAWAGDILTLPERYSEPADQVVVSRFTDEMRERLDRLDKWAGRTAPPQTNVFERGRPAAGVSRPSNNTREVTACEDASIADVPAGGYSSADENTLNYAQSEKYKPQTHLATSVDSRITGPVEEVSQGFSSVFAEANHRHALNGIGETGLHDDHSPAVIGLLDGAVVSGTFFSTHNADFESEDKRPALVRQGTGLLPDATHGTSEVEAASVASTAPPENHLRGEDAFREALEEIVNPIAAMQRRAEAEGGNLDGMMANALAKDPEYLKGIARAALAMEGQP